MRDLSKYSEYGAYLLLVIGVASLFEAICFAKYPVIGHDYAYFIPRLIETTDFIWQNWDIQYFTRLCGGLPAYGNPQSMQFSLFQLAFLVFPAKIALTSTFLIFFVLSFWGSYKYLNSILKVSRTVALSGSILFITNGFFIAHMLVGHLSFASYVLIPLVLYLFHRAHDFGYLSKQNMWYLIWASFVLSSFIYGGGYIVTIICLIGGLLSALFVGKISVKNLLMLGVTTGMLVVSKIVAVIDYLPYFVHNYQISKTNGFFESLLSAFSQLFFIPGLGVNSELSRQFGWWELCGWLSPSLFLAFLLEKKPNSSQRMQRLKFVVLSVFVVGLLSVVGGYVLAVAINSSLPIFSALWVLPRYNSLLGVCPNNSVR